MVLTLRLIKETAGYYFISYYIGGYERAGWYRIVNFKPISADTDNVLVISCIPTDEGSENNQQWR